MDWSELKQGDRVHHFDYGAGTVRSSGPVLLLIDWDTPNGYDYHWTSAIARHLTLHTDGLQEGGTPEARTYKSGSSAGR